ncbi:MAG: taurine ABC transporter substrate-binding protein, partial [Rhizobiaceae bacterium]|nr:taurine ABC transporter substrate-binding protein [Rhizobiaceae bacterium]
SELKKTGKVLATSADVAKWGGPTFDAWIVSKKFADAHPEVVTGFVKVTGAAYASYRKDPASWGAKSTQAAEIARLTGAKVEEVPELLKGYYFPTIQEQASAELLGGGTTKAVAETSAFLLEQGKIPAVLKDYSPYVSDRWVKQAAKAGL